MGCKIHSGMWEHEKIVGLSATEKLLWTFILTGPHAIGIPGLWVIGPADMAQRVDVSRRMAGLMLDKMSRLGLLDFNPKAHVVCVPSAPRHNPPENARVLASWFRTWCEIQDCRQKHDYADALRDAVAGDTLIAQEWANTFGAEGATQRRRQSRPVVRHRDLVVPRATAIYVAARDGGLCRYCNIVADSIDHVLPRRQGGGNEPENLVACCLPCNKRKRNRTPEQANMALLPLGGG